MQDSAHESAAPLQGYGTLRGNTSIGMIQHPTDTCMQMVSSAALCPFAVLVQIVMESLFRFPGGPSPSWLLAMRSCQKGALGPFNPFVERRTNITQQLFDFFPSSAHKHHAAPGRQLMYLFPLAQQLMLLYHPPNSPCSADAHLLCSCGSPAERNHKSKAKSAELGTHGFGGSPILKRNLLATMASFACA